MTPHRDLAAGLTGTERAIAKAAIRLTNATRARHENVANAHTRLAAAIDRLAEKRCADPLAGIPVVDLDTWAVQNAPEWIKELEARDGVLHWTTRARLADEADDHQPALTYHPPGVEFAPLPDTGNRPPSLAGRYGGSGATYYHAMGRLAAAGLRHGYQLGNTRTCWGCHTPVNPTTLACACYTPNTKEKENA